MHSVLALSRNHLLSVMICLLVNKIAFVDRPYYPETSSFSVSSEMVSLRPLDPSKAKTEFHHFVLMVSPMSFARTETDWNNST